MNAMWNDAMKCEITRLDDMGVFSCPDQSNPRTLGDQRLVKMDLDVDDMNAFFKDEHLIHGEEVETNNLESALKHMQSSSIQLAPKGDFKALLRHAKGKGHCDGAQFDLFANDLKYGVHLPGSTHGPQLKSCDNESMLGITPKSQLTLPPATITLDRYRHFLALATMTGHTVNVMDMRDGYADFLPPHLEIPVSPDTRELPRFGDEQSIAAAESELRSHFDMLESVWNAAMTTGRPPEDYPSPTTPPSTPPDVSSYSSEAPLNFGGKSSVHDKVYDSSCRAEADAAAAAKGIMMEDILDDERLGVGHLVLGTHDPTFIRYERLEEVCVICQIPITRLASCRTCVGYVCLTCGNPRCSKCDGHLIRDPNRVNYKQSVFSRDPTPNDFTPRCGYVQKFSDEDRRRELLDERSMAVEIAEEARLPFVTRMQLIKNKQDQDIQQVEQDLLNFSIASWEEDLQHFSNTDGYNCPE